MTPPARPSAPAEAAPGGPPAPAAFSWTPGLQRRAVLAALSGILLVFCFPKFDWQGLAWVALVPMLAAVEGASPRRAFWLGAFAGMVGYAGIVSWVTVTMTRYGNLPLPVAWVIMLALAGYMSLYTGAFCGALAWAGGANPPLRTALAPFLWTALELLRTHLFGGFPWASLGYTQYAALAVIQVADVTGVYGVSFLVVAVNAALWGVLRGFAPGFPRGRGRAAGWTLAVVAALVGAALLYGRDRLQAFRPPASGGSLQVALLQGNIAQDLKWDEEYRLSTLQVYRNLTIRYAADRPDLIVWPETAAPFFFLREKGLREAILDLAAEVKTPILLGAPSALVSGRDYKLRNSAYLVTPEKKVDGEYHKMHLVPYGEYVPLQRLLPFVRKVVTGIGDFVPGRERTVFSHPKAPFSVLICYEVIFPDEVRRFVRGGARFLVNITNDAWFGRSAAPYQHIAMTALRAVENRVPLVRAANTGITGVTDATGRIRETTGLFVRTGVVTRVEPGRPGPGGLTLYARYGDAFAYLSAGTALLILIFARIRSPARAR